MAYRHTIVPALLVLIPFLAWPSESPPVDSEPITESTSELDQYQVALLEIAKEIVSLQPLYPQLSEFAVDVHCDLRQRQIAYSYRTHRPPQTGGWSSGVPSPDPDGVWFYISIFDSSSTRQIHRQPMGGRWRIGEQEAIYLIKEGEETASVNGAIARILQDNGLESIGFAKRPAN